jgi:hypothetical protein
MLTRFYPNRQDSPSQLLGSAMRVAEGAINLAARPVEVSRAVNTPFLITSDSAHNLSLIA